MTSLDRMSTNRMVSTIRKGLAELTNAFLFEPNDDMTRDQLKAAMEVYLSELSDRGGIHDYVVKCDAENNPSGSQLNIDVFIKPVRSVEMLTLPMRISKTVDASWTPELAQDLAAQHGLDLEAEVTAILAAEITAQIDREMIDELKRLATVYPIDEPKPLDLGALLLKPSTGLTGIMPTGPTQQPTALPSPTGPILNDRS